MVSLLFLLAVCGAPLVFMAFLVFFVKTATEAENPPAASDPAKGQVVATGEGRRPPAWRIERWENGSERLVVGFDNIGFTTSQRLWAGLGSTLAVLVAGLTLAATLPLATLAVAAVGLAGLMAWFLVRHLCRVVETVVDLNHGLVYHRHRRLLFGEPRYRETGEFGIVLSHMIGEAEGVGVYLSGRDGEIEIARFGPLASGSGPYAADHPEAEALRSLLAEKLGLRQFGVL